MNQFLVKSIVKLDDRYYQVSALETSQEFTSEEAEFFDRQGNKVSGRIVLVEGETIKVDTMPEKVIVEKVKQHLSVPRKISSIPRKVKR